jgi:hypothetical protein
VKGSIHSPPLSLLRIVVNIKVITTLNSIRTPQKGELLALLGLKGGPHGEYESGN